MTHKLVPNLSFPMYFLEAGKPDPNVRWEKGDIRPRVKQSEQKEGTCWYYSRRRFVEHIGKQFPPEYADKRKIEQIFSQLRKDLTQAQKHYNTIVIEKLLSSIIQNPSPSELKEKLSDLENLINRISEQNRPGFILLKPKITEALEIANEYCKQSQFNKLHDYLENSLYITSISAYNQFFKNMKVDPAVMYRNMKQQKHMLKKRVGPLPDFSFESLSNKNKKTHLAHFSQSVINQVSGFKPSKWDPKQNIDILINDLIAYGPLLIAGFIGTPYHKEEPVVAKKIAGHSVYVWKKREIMNNPKGHNIVVVGARKDGNKGGRIYFIDPNNGSDPKDPESDPIYMHSYQHFKDHVIETFNIPTTPQNEHELLSASFTAYAYYHEPEILSNSTMISKKSNAPIEITSPGPIQTCQVFVNCDVGFGNSLGVRIDPSWETSIPLTWSPEGWTGQIPAGKEFKFVKIFFDGSFEWETRESNRIFSGEHEGIASGKIQL